MKIHIIKIIVPNANIQIINYIFKIISDSLKNIKFELYDTHILPPKLNLKKFYKFTDPKKRKCE